MKISVATNQNIYCNVIKPTTYSLPLQHCCHTYICTTYALPLLHCYHAYNLCPTLTALLSCLQPVLCPTLTSKLPCLQPMPYHNFIVTMPTAYAIPLLHCCHANNLSYALPLLHCYHAYKLWFTLCALLPCLQPMTFPLCIVTMPTTCDLPFALHVHPWEGHILHCLSCVIFITRVTKAVVSIHKSPGISMCDRKGCYKYLSVNKSGELKSFNTNINSYGNQFKINYPSLDYFYKPLKTYIKWSSSLQVHYLFL